MAVLSTLILIPPTLLVVYIIHFAISSYLAFQRHLRHVRASGLPYVIRICAEFNYLYLILTPIISPIAKYVPRWLDPSGYSVFYEKDWRIKHKYKKHAEIGNVYWNVSPGTLMLEVADHHVWQEISARRMDFGKQMKFLAQIQIFGPNIVACPEVHWKRHRRVIGPQFNEDFNAFAWDHAIMLTKGMFEGWCKSTNNVKPKKGNVELRDLRNLALRVVAGSAFETKIQFRSGEVLDSQSADVHLDKATKFGDSFCYLMENIISFMIFPRWVLSPSKQAAFNTIGEYMSEMIKKQQKKSGSKGFLAGLTGSLAPAGIPPGPNELSYDEVTGNIFLMGLAGSETTADTIHFALILLALHQDQQALVFSQLQAATRSLPAESWTYSELFPKLKFMHNLMLETLRLYPATPMNTRCNEDTGQTLKIGDNNVYIPPCTTLMGCVTAIHYNPSIWGPTVAEFNPQRWEAKEPEQELAFSAFGNGQRACLGRRFSETEFVAVIVTLLKDYRVELAEVMTGEGMARVKERVKNALDNSGTYLTLEVGGEVPLKFVER